MKTLGFFTALIVITGYTHAQISIPAGKRITETFNSLGIAPGPIPTNWKMSAAGQGNTASWFTANNITATTQLPTNGGDIPTTGGPYNWGSYYDLSNDRALGFMTNVDYPSPNSIMAFYRNLTGATLNQVNVSFDIEQYVDNRSNFSLSFWSSTDGINWTSRPEGDVYGGLFRAS